MGSRARQLIRISAVVSFQGLLNSSYYINIYIIFYKAH